MEDEDYRIMVLNDTTMKVFRDGRISTLSKRSKYEKWNQRKFTLNHGYQVVNIDKRHRFVHTIIALCYLGEKPQSLDIDHINSIRDDNRLDNLQYISKIENDRKRLTMNKQYIKGYTKRPNGKYESSICVLNKRLYLGQFDIEEDARQAFIVAKLKYHKVNLLESKS